MAQNSNLAVQASASLPKRMLIGAGIGLVMILFFILQADKPIPAEWGRLWMIKPLIVTPLSAAMGGLMYHMADRLRQQQGWNRLLLNILGLLVFLVVLWLGIVLGLNGTMWN